MIGNHRTYEKYKLIRGICIHLKEYIDECCHCLKAYSKIRKLEKKDLYII